MKQHITSKSIALPGLSPAYLKTALPIFIALLFAFGTRTLRAQTVIGGDIPDSSAILDLQSTDKGLLIPRMSETQRNAIAGPAMGLIVLNTTNNCLEINLGTPAVPEWAAVTCRIGTLSTINCSGATPSSTLTAGVSASGVSVQIPYTGGNGGTHSGQTATSTGVTGLTATLAAGNFTNGADSLTYTISGTPAAAGTAIFALSIGGQSCTLELTVAAPAPSCWAKVSATDTLFFMCHNLASANTSADPFTPSWEIIGGYWQWGRKGPDASQWLNTNTTEFAHGPTGPGAGEANSASISGWNQTYAPSGDWSDFKTANDPCPNGYRVPTKVQWDAVIANNTRSTVGTNWTDSATNYSTGLSLGSALMLPAAGIRGNDNGALFYRGDYGFYWSSKENGTDDAWNLYFSSGNASTSNYDRRFGFSVRCAADPAAAAGSLGSLDCSNAAQTGTLTAGTAANGVSLKVPYTGGNGGTHSGQTATSTGVTGLTATLAAGNFTNGADSLTYTISGTPAAAGTASFALNIGGQSCTLELTVAAPAPSCWAKVSATDTLFFMCHNLASANTSADPFTPSWEIIGGYWQWGRKGPDASQWLNTNTTEFAHGPTGPGAGEANNTTTSGWSSDYAPDGSWMDNSKTADDPCPAGYRIPTRDQWNAVLANNTQTAVGANWTAGATNYTTGRSFGSALMLPATGFRGPNDSSLDRRGSDGYYWSSTEYSSDYARYLGIGSSNASTSYGDRTYGHSIRCVTDPAAAAGSLGSLDCSNAAQTGTLTAGTAASSVSVKVPYTGGNGGTHSGQTATSTGVTGLTATLAAGNFATGADSLSYSISGTPSGAGTASFALSIGGQSCTLELTVAAPAPSCWAKVSATDTLFFMCHNLASANTSADPFTPSWEIIGGYWQWGRKGPDASQWLNTNTTEFAHGPTGPGAGEANSASISGWNQTYAPSGAWSDNLKTANDPCPNGYRVPTKAQWDAVLANNTRSNVGTNWTSSATNYSTGLNFGTALMLPVTGSRNSSDGAVSDRGLDGYYCSTTEDGMGLVFFIYFGNGYAQMITDIGGYGMSIRCVADNEN